MLAKREIPKINGSATAFIVLVVILVFIIIIACSATIYLLREDIAEDREALTSGARGRYHLSGSQDGPTKKSSKNWLTGFLRLPGSHKRTSKVRPDNPRTIPGRPTQGWFPAGNGSDWDSDGLPPRNSKRFTPSATMRMADQDTLSLGTPRSSNVGSFPHAHIYNSTSDVTSSVRFDPHGIRGLSYADQSSLSVPGIISSFQSQLYSPPSSPSLSPIPAESSRTALAASPEPMERSLTNDSFDESFGTPSESRPTIRTFEGGTKFIEAL